MIEGACLCGAVRWEFDGVPEGATACNCTACRRYGTLWAYDHEGERIRVSGPDPTLRPRHRPGVPLLPAPAAASPSGAAGRSTITGAAASPSTFGSPHPAAVAAIPIDHFDGLVSFDDLPRDGRCVADMWF